MKLVIGSVATLAGVFFALSLASANPSMIPKHPGYPAKQAHKSCQWAVAGE